MELFTNIAEKIGYTVPDPEVEAASSFSEERVYPDFCLKITNNASKIIEILASESESSDPSLSSADLERIKFVFEKCFSGIVVNDYEMASSVALPLLAKMQNLRSLNLSGTGLVDEDIEPLASMTQLEVLDLSCNKLKISALQLLIQVQRDRSRSIMGTSTLNLKSLNLSGNKSSVFLDESFSRIAGLSKLEILDISDLNIDNFLVLKNMLRSLKKMKTVVVSSQDRDDMADIDDIRSSFPEVEIIDKISVKFQNKINIENISPAASLTPTVAMKGLSLESCGQMALP